jgi:putative restriction endonuclease
MSIFEKFVNLNTNRNGDRRSPHKPLLVLIAISKLQQGKAKMSYSEATKALLPLLNSYAPPIKNRHQPALPYWHLRSDGLWDVTNANHLPKQMSGFPRISALRETTAGFTQDVADGLLNSAKLTDKVIQFLLKEHFPPSIHDDLLDHIGLNKPQEQCVHEFEPEYQASRRRNPGFRNNVLRAYEHRCAVTGFRAALSGTYFGCEAAHIKWHAYDGPDVVANGVCLEPTIHKLFDVGAWTLTDNRRILVSKNYTGSDIAISRLRTFHGASLQDPIAGEPKISIEYIKWHREPQFGGVFHGPALKL